MVAEESCCVSAGYDFILRRMFDETKEIYKWFNHGQFDSVFRYMSYAIHDW